MAISSRPKQRKREKVYSWSEYAENATIDGINFAYGSEHPTSKRCRVAWTIFLVFCCVSAALITVSNWQIYLSEKVVESIRYENERSIDFPAITICSTNVMKKSYGSMSDLARFLIKDFSEQRDMDVKRFVKEVGI